ncbi:6620_t:CDS:2 [Diversispora eburnea]|uniref:6620_t:CDS:1 n=1 Tax=Diversispora eburnea TaxID=1213867 RepID=A0A9N9BDN3_9GLOM|nr:6620_t:CDS:2 [Diversispora eburnea]
MYFSFETIPTFVWVFIATFVIYWIKDPRLSNNEPPMVPYKIPIIGPTLDYLFNAETGNEISHEVYKSDAFSMYSALDIVEYLLNNPEYKTKVITDDNLNKIRDFLFILFVVFTHTTSFHFTCALYERLELWDDIYEEQVRIDKECNGELISQHINKMVKLDSFLRESLRTFDSLPLPTDVWNHIH